MLLYKQNVNQTKGGMKAYRNYGGWLYQMGKRGRYADIMSSIRHKQCTLKRTRKWRKKHEGF